MHSEDNQTADQLEQAMAKAVALCRKKGARFTSQRQYIYRLILQKGRPLGAYDLLQTMKAEIPGVAPPTVYRALDFLLEQGLIHKLESLHAFVVCSEPEHVHDGQFLICSQCGQAEELDDQSVRLSLNTLMRTHGFNGRHQVVELMGRCCGCAGRGQ
jgi:Fur family zinc uptake transcriptional regulator